MSDAVKVIVASVMPKGDHSLLKLTTADKLDVYFELDDLALGLLAVTAQVTTQAASASRPTEKDVTIFARSDETGD